MKQKRFGLIVANILPILALIGEVALIINHQIGWVVGISVALVVISYIIFCLFPYGEESIFLSANAGYALTILASWLISFIEPSASLYLGLVFGCATALVQGILTMKRVQGKIWLLPSIRDTGDFSYPTKNFISLTWWIQQGSNLRPYECESYALANWAMDPYHQNW